MKEIRAKQGMYLTQNGEVSHRIYVTALKGVNINESDWREATKEEKDAYEAERKSEKAKRARQVK